MATGAGPHVSTPPVAEVSGRLAVLGLDADVLSDSLLSGVRAASEISPHHPVTARGFTVWSESVAALRSALVARGWGKDDVANFPRVVSPDGAHAVVVVRGNEATGRSVGRPPGLARRRGPVTQRAVEVNGQMDLFHWADIAQQDAVKTWMLLYGWSREEPVVRAELSLPSRMSGGDVVGWEERILLPEMTLQKFDIGAFDVSADDEVYFGIAQTS